MQRLKAMTAREIQDDIVDASEEEATNQNRVVLHSLYHFFNPLFLTQGAQQFYLQQLGSSANDKNEAHASTEDMRNKTSCSVMHISTAAEEGGTKRKISCSKNTENRPGKRSKEGKALGT